ncbi:tenascin-X isoform X22 [Erinaceus europaeus]|uniref:Tenascin-X isoform X22 n=1 Tax=Erinaceus europaeus TaxID=9365 RepID=A0ABM3X9L5_ERIEU|nr:tenascin-X isoform X22 [Erinaceus europaeus]
MMPTPCSLTSSLALLVLLGTVRAGPFSPRFNITRPGPRPPPQPGGHTAEPGVGSPSAQLYEHTVEGGEKQVVFTHRINLPPSAGCGCPPGTEPPAPASEVQSLKVRLEILEELVQGLKEQCTGGCCPVTAKAGTGQTDTRSLCSLHGVFDLSRCACSCEPGWGGPTCSDPTDAPVSPSSSPSCPDDCNDQGRCVRGRCECFPGYTGPSCSWPSCPGDCHGRGRCVQGVCVCRPGFSGADCSLRACPRGCSQKGRCEDGRCVCNPGYTGDDCGVKSCPRDCSQRGRCENGRCVCNPGYTGDDCGARSCPRGCSQKGRCEDGRCVCEPGYTGADCGSRSCPWDCGEGGRCVDGRCVCWPGYAGDDCSRRTCPRDCHGRGRCEDGECLCDAGYSGDDCGVRSCPGDCSQRGRCEDGRCVCWPGYTGPDCGAKSCPRDCRGRGRCEAGVCVCHPGYGGDDCGVRSCPGDCRGRGRCESGRCVCWPGYTGRDCGVRACPGDCRGRGRCVDGRCICNPGFAGDDCGSRRCPGDCRGRGRCEDGVCVCDAGYQGEDCGARSCPGGCRGRGQCLDGRCVCDDGYEGEDCGVRRCPRDCSQRGVCQDGVCACWEGYAGEDCGLRTCPSNCHGRGRCEEGRCVCDSGYTGPTCGVRTCPSDCRGHGRCVQGVCVCHPGYSGPDCGQDEPPASACPGGCGPRELCREGRCVCVEGFRGPDCAIQTCPADCLGRGECLEGSCVCQEGYAGEDCSEEIPAIENMRMHLLEETTVRTEWTRGPGTVDAYEIQFIPMTEGMSPPFTARVPSSASAYDQRGLAPGQEYQVTVRALRGTSWGPPASKTITTMIDGPQDLRVVAVTPTTLDLSWLRPQAEVDRFVVSYVSAGNQRVRLEVPPEADRALLTDLMPGVEYVVTVTAERGPAVSYPASIRANTEKPEKPEKPLTLPRLGELTVTDAASSSLTLHWTVSEGEFDSFVIQYKDRDGPQVVPVEGSQREALITNLELNRKYKFVLYGMVGKKKHGPLVAEAKIVPQSDPISETSPRLGKLWVTDPTPDSLHLSWTVPEGQFDSFLVQYRGKDGQPQVIPVEGPERSATVSQLAPDHKYRFTLFGIANRKRHGPLMAEGTTAPEKKPGHPEPLEQPLLGKLTVNGATPDSLVLSWTVDQGSFDSFMVQYKDAQGQPQAVPVRGHENTVTIRGLESNRKYKMNLYGLHGRHRVGPVSVVASTAPQEVMETPTEPPSTEAPEPPEEPLLGKLTVTGSSQDSLSLSWTVPQGHFDRFLVQYKNGDGQPKVVRVPGTQDWVTISGLEPDHKYKVNLYGFHNGQRVGPISATGVTATEEKTPTETEVTPTEPPSTEAPESPEEPLLGELTVTGSSQDSLSLSWTVPQGHFDRFLVQYKNGDGQPKVVRVPGTQDWVTISGLEPDHKYKVNLYGFHNGQRVGPISATGVTATEEKTPTETEVTPTEPPSTEAPESPEEPLLGELTVTGSSQDSLSLSWTVPQGHFDRFLVQYKNGDGQPKVVRVPGTQDWVTISGLEPDHKYKMNLYGFHNGQRVGPISAFGVTDAVEETPTPTEPPSTEAPEPTVEPLLGELTVTGSSQDSLSLSWTVPQGHFDSFTIQYKDRDGQPQVVRVGGEEREVTVQGLDAGRKYKMHLYGLHGGQRVGPASTVGVTEDEPSPVTTPPLEPRLGQLTVTSVTPSSVGLSWTVPEGKFDSFVVQYKGKDGQPQMVPVSKDQLEVTIPGLEPARKYKMNLYGLQSGQRVGPLSVVAMTAPLPTVPATEPPQEPQLGDLTVTDVTPDSVGLLWTVPGGEFDSFVVQYKDKDGQPQVVPMAADQREATIPGLEPNKKYKFLLFGIKDGKRSSPLSVEAKTVASPGTTPRLGELWVTDPTPDSLHLSWTVPEGHFDSFVVQFKDRDGPRLVPVEGQERSVTITPLDANRKYRFLLYGLLGKKRYGPLTADGTTENRGSQDDTGIKRLPKPRLGEELQVTSVTPDSVDLSWTVTEGHFDSFVVQYKDKDGQPQVVPVEGSLREVRVPDLDPGRRYKLLLYGLHQGKRVGPLSTTAVTGHREDIGTTTLTSNTPAPEVFLGELTVVEATPHTLHLSWIETEGEFDSFEVQFIDQTGKQEVLTVGGDQKDITLYDLESDHRYLVNLYGFHGQQRVGPAQVEALTVLREEEDEPSEPPTISSEPPFKPLLGELTVTGSSQDSLSLSWTIPEGHFDSFVIQYKNGDEQPKIVQVPGHQNWVTISGLEPDHKYKVNLYGFYSDQRVGPISAVGVTDAVEETPIPTEPPSTEAPEPPEEPLLGELTVSGSSQDSLSLSWTVPQGHFDSFTIQYKDKDGQPQVVRVRGEEREVTVRGLDAGRKYKMHLYGLHGGQRVGPVSTVGVTEPEGEPTSPPVKPLLGELTVTGSSQDSLSLSWTVPQGQFDHFLVQYKNGDGQPKVLRVPGTQDWVTISGLEPDHKYKMNLYGFHGDQREGPISTVGVTGKDEEMTPFPTDGPTTTPEPPFKPHLGELTVTGSSQDSLSLSWTVPQGHFDRFLVQYKNGDGQPKVVRVPGTQDWVTISGLEPDHKYKVNLYGFHNGQRVGPISAIGVTDAVEETPTLTEPLSTEAPEPSEEPLLGELTVTGSSQDSLSLSWTVPQGQFDRFLVQYKNGDGQPKVVRVPGTQDWVTISGLEPDHKYKVNLYGFHNGQRVGPISATGVTATEEKTPTETEVTPTEPPSTEAPESPEEPLLGELTVTGSSQDSLSLSWTVPQGHFDRFLVQYKNGDGQPKVVRVPGTQDWVTISGLEPDHKYKVNLYGFHNGQRVGPISAFGVTDAVEETPTPTEPPSTEAPDPPVEPLLGELTVTGSSQDSLSLSWTVPQGHFDSFTIQYKDRDGQPQVVRVGGEEREVTVRGLDAGRKYKMHLYGLHGGQRVGPVSTVGVTASLPTEPPVALSLGELTVVSVASDTVHLSWTVAQGPFDSFLVQYKDSQGQPQAVPVDGSLREVIVSGLDPARKYKFLLFGLQDEKKHGPVSTEAKTLPDKKPSPRLGDLTVTDVTPDSVGLLWTVPEGEFDSFVVQYKDKDRQPQVVPVAADQRKVTIPGLEPKKKYKFLLYGLAGRKRLGPVSAEGTTAPLEKELPPLPRLGELTLTDETPDSIHLSWTVAQGPFDSFVVQYRGTDGQPRAVPVAADEREVTIEGLEAGKKYKFLLFGLFRGQRLGPISGLGATASAEDTPIPGIPATEAPEGPRLGVLTVNSVAPDALRLSWSVAQGVFESFVIQYRDTDGKSQALLVDGDQSTVLVSSLEPSTPYMFSLYGLHGGKRLGPISAEGITGPAPPAGEIPGEPRPRLSQLSVTDVTTSSLRLNWEAPPGAFDSFLLRFGVPSQSSLEPYPRPLLQRELTVPGSRRSAAIRDLRPGTLYNLTLYGLRGPHKADSIQGSARTLSPVLESPHDLQFSEIGETSAKVSWTPPPSRVDSFKVSYQLADGGEPQSVRVDSRAQTQTLKGLAPGTRYEVTVVSIRGFEESEPLTGFFTTVSDGPTKLQALNLTEGSTVLHWDPPQNPVDTYDVQVTAPEAPSLQASAPGSAVDYPLSGLELHTNYTAMVRGLRGSNFTSPANITFTTGLEAPRDLEAKEVTPRTALLTWTEPPDPPTGYLLSFNTPGEQTQEILLPGGVTSHRLLGLFPSTTYNAFLRAVWGESFSPPMPTSFTTGGLRIPFPRDCGEEMQNGISTSRTTTIFLNGNRERPLDVFCDMETDGGGWLVFQRRMDGKTDFWRDWEDYAHGFGNISREFWLGNEALHSLTSSGDYSLRVDLRAGDEAVFAHYDSFRVDSAAKYYQLHLEGYHGTAGDSMTYHSGSVFSARDRDPNNLLISCAVSYRGAWWYRNCHYANLNGLYGSTVDHQGVSWYYWKGFGFSVPFTEMKLRPRNYHPPAWGG